jgi:hypothetical protein
MNYAKKYVEYLLEQKAQSVQAAPSAPVAYGLPGLRTFAQLGQKRKEVLKRELQIVKDSLVSTNRKSRSKKFANVKADLKVQAKYLKRRIAELQFQLGREKEGDQNAE